MLGLRDLFPDERLFAVEDVMPACKPEPAAFAAVLKRVGATAGQVLMVEDSMKNIRAAKAIGMHTVLVRGKQGGNDARKAAAEATKPGDAPQEEDPAIDVVVDSANELEAALPGLWQTPAVWEVADEG